MSSPVIDGVFAFALKNNLLNGAQRSPNKTYTVWSNNTPDMENYSGFLARRQLIMKIRSLLKKPSGVKGCRLELVSGRRGSFGIRLTLT